MENKIRTSAEVASLAAHLLKGIDQLRTRQMLEDALFELWLEDAVQSLAGSALSNRRG